MLDKKTLGKVMGVSGTMSDDVLKPLGWPPFSNVPGISTSMSRLARRFVRAEV
jgi:hypothetical protein